MEKMTEMQNDMASSYKRNEQQGANHKRSKKHKSGKVARCEKDEQGKYQAMRNTKQAATRKA
jgi:hypothetical protein